MELNQDSYIKRTGSVVAQDAQKCIEAFVIENIRLHEEHQLRKEADERKRILHRDHTNNVITQYIERDRCKSDMDELFAPYYEEVSVHGGWRFWKQTTTTRFNYRNMLEDSDKIRSALIGKCPEFWHHMPYNWWFLNPSVMLQKTIHNCRTNMKFGGYEEQYQYECVLHQTDRLERLIKLQGDVYLTISDHNHLLECLEKVDELRKNNVSR